MGVPSDDVVVIQKGRRPGEPCIITVNCPDKTGLGCDICRIILDFGLLIEKADFSTDGIWCYIVLWVFPDSSSPVVKLSNLKNQLQSVCPSCSVPFYLYQQATRSSSSPVYLLTFLCLDRKGLLHGNGNLPHLHCLIVLRDLLHTKERQDETIKQLRDVLGESCISCELQLVGPEYESLHGIPSLSPVVAEELFRCELLDKETRSQALSPDMTKLKKTNVTMDNSLSPAHTLLQIHCADHKGLLYDILRTLKDCNIKIAYGRISPNIKGYRDLDLFIQQNDGKKFVDPDKQSALYLRLKVEMLHPLRVIIANRGPDTELLVANPVELSGKGRPRVFYDVTTALKTLGICIFSVRKLRNKLKVIQNYQIFCELLTQAEIGRVAASDREWEVYTFLLEENHNFQLSNMVAKNQIADRVRRTLMGW
ncbi:ACT domain-containing protein ACR9-like isoform X2 [Malus domestica]|uniref:ACT domain-containing protein ACR9-like isoform X2 n=1 Tax=Malus domestica TaxID=3750 RepID=UPI0010AABE67|nr:ACT domain-containing protein ACR9-like isoform X2 [Malus domestica]